MTDITTKTFDIPTETLNYVQRLFHNYSSKKDIINTLFDIHKFDTDSTVIDSVPFKTYELKFAEAKVEFDEAMKEIEETYIPLELREIGSKFEVDFDNGQVVVTPPVGA